MRCGVRLLHYTTTIRGVVARLQTGTQVQVGATRLRAVPMDLEVIIFIKDRFDTSNSQLYHACVTILSPIIILVCRFRVPESNHVTDGNLIKIDTPVKWHFTDDQLPGVTQ